MKVIYELATCPKCGNYVAVWTKCSVCGWVWGTKE